MNLIEALNLLNKGKKIRRKAWAKCMYIWLDKDNQLIDNLGQNAYYLFGSDEIKTDNWEEYKEPILDEKEKEYLSAVIKPFRSRVVYIRKVEAGECNQYISIKVKRYDYEEKSHEYIDMPYFKKDTMYKNMELGKEYNLEELGL